MKNKRFRLCVVLIIIVVLTGCEGLNLSFTPINNIISVTGIILSPDKDEMTISNTLQLHESVEPLDAEDTSVVWISSDSEVASVDIDGLVSAHSAGDVVITAITNDGGFEAQSLIKVIENPNNIALKDITVYGENSCNVGDLIELSLIFDPVDTSNKNVIWASSNESVATVDGGTVSALSTGDTRVTVTTEDGGIQDYIDISVSELTGNTTDVIFLRHSTGGWIFNYGLERDYGTENHNAYDNIYNPEETGVGNFFIQYNADSGTDYRIQKRAYPNDDYGWENYPYDYWNLWVNHSSEEIYRGQDTLSALTADYDVIIWKHCYPGSQIENDTGYPDIQSNRKSLENYKLQYNAIKDEMRKYPETKFIVWTSALETESNMGNDYRENTRSFVNWVRHDWDEPGDNIFTWDLYYLETNRESAGYNLYPSDSWDSHPTESFNNAAGPLFAQRVIDVIEGKGDTSLTTGEKGAVKGQYWVLNP